MKNKDKKQEFTYPAMELLPTVTRVEIIDHSEGVPMHHARAYVKYGAKKVEISFQDDNRTLKIFIK